MYSFVIELGKPLKRTKTSDGLLSSMDHQSMGKPLKRTKTE